MNKLLFEEKQRFTQWWLWLLMIGVGCIPLYAIYKQLILGIPFGNNPMSDVGTIIFSVFVFSLIALMGSVNLKTEIYEDEIRMRLFPFTRKKIKWNEIRKVEIIKYGFVGGWGIRGGTKYGTVYNMRGNKGLAIELKNGKKFIIGTQQSEKLSQVLKDIYKL